MRRIPDAYPIAQLSMLTPAHLELIRLLARSAVRQYLACERQQVQSSEELPSLSEEDERRHLRSLQHGAAVSSIR